MTDSYTSSAADLLQDLKIATAYAARAGTLRDPNLIATVQAAEQQAASGGTPDFNALTQALSVVTQAIAPVTLADLKFGRDPFDPANQERARRLQLSLTLFALIVLVLIGYFMHSLRREQSAIATLQEIQNLRPTEKLTALRKMAQFENPLVLPSTLYDQYHERVSELMRIKERIQNSYMQAVEAVGIPLFPFGDRIPHWGGDDTQSVPAMKSDADPGTAAPVQVAAAPAPTPDAVPQADALAMEPPPALCIEDANGRLKLTSESLKYPVWMQNVLLDTLNDFCFQLKVLSPQGDSALLNQNFSAFSFVSRLKEKVSLRTEWFLPFLYGLLGAALFMMRNIANVRTPAMEWFPVVMRVSLGGVAGIVIGWFSAAANTGTETMNAAFLPFGLAFLTGYGIDALFTLMDKLNAAIGQVAK